MVFVEFVRARAREKAARAFFFFWHFTQSAPG